jgi:tight adherence protein B
MDPGNVNVGDRTYAFALAAVFAGTFLLVAAFNHFFIDPILQRRRLNARLRGNKREQEIRAQIFKAYQEADTSIVLGLLQKLVGLGKIENLQRALLQADIYLGVGTFLCLVGILGSAGFILGLVTTSNFLYAFGLAALVGFLPIFYLRWKKRRKALLFEKQMPDAMELLARSVRAGHTLGATLELVSQEVPPPLGMEMRITYEEQRLGLSMGQALRRMGERVDSQDLRYFVTAVLIQMESGGNLAEILENIGFLIRERLKLKGKIRGLTAEGRFSAIILALLPVVTFLALYFLNRDYIVNMLKDPLGVKILMTGVISVLIGVLVMKRMVNIKV